MKIAYVYDAVYPWETGGVQKRVWELARRLADDHDVHWYGLRYWDGPAVREVDGVTLHGVARAREFYSNGHRSITEALRFGARLVRPLFTESFDVIDCQEFPYFSCFPSKLASHRSGGSLLVTWHEVWEEYWYEYLGWKGVFGAVVERTVSRLPDAHVAVSSHTGRALSALGVGAGYVIPNGIDTRAIEHAPASTEPIDVLFVGRLIAEKNPALVVRAVAAIRETHADVRCVLVGDGPERAVIERLVERYGLEANVALRDAYETHEEVLGLMKAADVLALPSRREGFGMVALEALACGTPVVTLDHPRNAAASLVEMDTTGYVTDATPAAVAEAVLAARTLSSGACVAAAREYEWDTIARQAEMVYETVRMGGA